MEEKEEREGEERGRGGGYEEEKKREEGGGSIGETGGKGKKKEGRIEEGWGGSEIFYWYSNEGIKGIPSLILAFFLPSLFLEIFQSNHDLIEALYMIKFKSLKIKRKDCIFS